MSLKELTLVVLLSVFALTTAVHIAEEETLLSGTLRIIFANIFKPKSMSVSVIVNISGHGSFNTNQDILNKVMLINKNIQVPVTINQHTALNMVHFIHAKLIFINSAENVRMRMENLFNNNEIETVSTKYLIVLYTQDSMPKKLIEMHNIFRDFFNIYIIDVVILVYDAESLLLYTYKPYNNNHCAFTKPTLLRRFEKVPEFILYHDLFPIKTKNFHQCPMKVVLWHIPPFAELTYQNDLVYFKGFDAKVLNDLAEYLNFSIEVVPNEPKNLISGQVFRNNTATGVFKLLLERKANLTIGFIACMPRRLQFTRGSMPYFLSQLLIIFKNSKKYTPFQLVLRPFSTSTWSFFIAVFILRPLFKRLLYRSFKLRQSFRKLLKLQWLLLIFLLRISYEGSILKAIRMTPYRQLPLTIDEVVKQNYSLITDYACARVLHEISILKNITTIVPGNPQTVLESLDDLPPNTCILTSDIFVSVFMKSRLSKYKNYAIVRDKVSNNMMCVFFPRLSYMAPMVNTLLKHYAMFGIFHKYGKDLGFENLPMTTDKFRRLYKQNPLTPLDLALLKLFLTHSTIAAVVDDDSSTSNNNNKRNNDKNYRNDKEYDDAAADAVHDGLMV
ncbi:uncharacterized protein LOC135958332 [Calliphora vicina]|uniref:uncharacterized protein LOC135958332 n=1 Tax=Calliphora vicina TaxID=7373 RepID=UPI00325BE3E5